MIEYTSYTIHPSPGQLWRNSRTGEVLFIFRQDAQSEGIWNDGRRKRNRELMKMQHGKDGWKCVYTPSMNDDLEQTDPHSYEYRAL